MRTITQHGGEGKKYEYEFEIFDNDGTLLGRVPIPEKSGKEIRVFYGRLFLIGAENMFIYEYKIVEK